MAQYERQGHEVLSVEHIETGTQTATVKRHHDLYAHVKLIPATSPVSVGADLVLDVELVAWDTGEIVTDMDRPVQVMVDGVQVDEVLLVAGRALVTLQFSDAGAYMVGVQGDLVKPAGLEVTVG